MAGPVGRALGRAHFLFHCLDFSRYWARMLDQFSDIHLYDGYIGDSIVFPGPRKVDESVDPL